MVVAVLVNAGVQIPLTPLLEVVGKGDNVAPEQMDDTGLKVGVTFELTVTVNVAVPLQPLAVPVTV